MKSRVSYERLREVLNYDADTGVFTWRLALSPVVNFGTVAGSVMAAGQVHIGIDGVYYMAHRLAWFYVHGVWPTKEIDHANMVKSDNRMANLRPANDQQNSANRRASRNNRLGVKGVGISTLRKRKPQRYRARIRVNNVLIHLGYFSTPELANAAYAEAARHHFGEFARAE